MTPLLSFLLKANLTLVLLYGFYFLCFRRDTFYGHIRYFLLATIVSAMLFPLIDFSSRLTDSPAAMNVSQYIPDVGLVYQYVFTQLQTGYTEYTGHAGYAVEPEIVARTIPFALIFRWCWLSVVVFMLGKRLFQLANIAVRWYRYPSQRHGNSAIIAVDGNIQPFSFFGRIFLNPSLYSKNQLNEIVAHEQIHCRQRHTLDILLAETLVCLSWFNPVAWLLRRDLKQNLEYFTDRMTLLRGFDRKHYQYSLLRVSVKKVHQSDFFQIANHFHFKQFYFNHLKKRIIMINKKNSPRILAVKYLLVVPALAATLLVLQISGLQAAEEYLSDEIINSEKENAGFILHKESATMSVNENKISYHKMDSVAFRIKREISNADTVKNVHITLYGGGEAILSGDRNETTYHKMDSVVFHGNPFPGTLILIDGKEGDINDIPPANIESFIIMKDEAATRIYGDKGKNGVVLFTTKKIKPNLKIDKTQDPDSVRQIFIRGLGLKTFSDRPLTILDGKIISNIEELSKIDPETIESISVLNDNSAMDLYGEKAVQGVIFITLKTEK